MTNIVDRTKIYMDTDGGLKIASSTQPDKIVARVPFQGSEAATLGAAQTMATAINRMLFQDAIQRNSRPYNELYMTLGVLMAVIGGSVGGIGFYVPQASNWIWFLPVGVFGFGLFLWASITDPRGKVKYNDEV